VERGGFYEAALAVDQGTSLRLSTPNVHNIVHKSRLIVSVLS